MHAYVAAWRCERIDHRRPIKVVFYSPSFKRCKVMLANLKFSNQNYSPETLLSYLNSEALQSDAFDEVSKGLFNGGNAPLQFIEVQLLQHVHKAFTELTANHIFSLEYYKSKEQLICFLRAGDFDLKRLFCLSDAIKHSWIKLSYEKLNEVFTHTYFQVFLNNILLDSLKEIKLLLIESVNEIDFKSLPLELLEHLVIYYGDYDVAMLKKTEKIINEHLSIDAKLEIKNAPESPTSIDKQLLTIPMTYKGHCYGDLQVKLKPSPKLQNETVKIIFNALANAFSYFIAFQSKQTMDVETSNANLKYHQGLEKALINIVDVTSKVLELRDAYTAGHQNRVTEICYKIGKKLSLGRSQLMGLNLAAQVHDIGKISIPSDILTKPSRLSVQEFELVKTHSQIGYQLLSPYDFPWPLAEIVYQHHERLDGTGYPRGLIENEILLEAKVLAVADAFESIMAHRPYRPAQGIEIAEKVLSNGNEYDQDIVKVCFELFELGELSHSADDV